jgi:hypothetical protein
VPLFAEGGNLSAGDGQFLPRFTVLQDPNFPDEFPFPPCHFCTAGHLPAGGSRLPPGFTIFSRPFLPLLAAFRYQMADRTPLPQFSDWHHCGLSFGDILMLDRINPGSSLFSSASLQVFVSFRLSFRSINCSSSVNIIST